MIGLPKEMLSSTEGSRGGGVMQVRVINIKYLFIYPFNDLIWILKSSASECVLVSLLAARAQKVKELKTVHPFVDEGVLLSKLIAYCSKEAHSCVEKAAMIAFVKLRILEPDADLALRGATLAQV